MSTHANEYPVMVTHLPSDHPLRARLSRESAQKVYTTGLPAEVVCARKANEPTALRYLGVAWTLQGVVWDRA